MKAVLAQRKRIRSPVGAGVFYPDDKKTLLAYIKSFGMDEGCGGSAQAIIAPHGAWRFSGTLAANAFFSAMGRSRSIKRVVILGPIHDRREEGIFLSNSYYFQTPLGKIPVDQKITEEFEFYGSFCEINDIPHLGEHSIEILLPFIKYCFPDASIVPVLMGQPNEYYITDLAKALKAVITPVLEETLLVVSCNLSSNNDVTKARLLAEESLRLFSVKNAATLASAIISGEVNPCGGALVVSLFESGLLEGKRFCSDAENMISAVDVENNTVFYNAVSFE